MPTLKPEVADAMRAIGVSAPYIPGDADTSEFLEEGGDTSQQGQQVAGQPQSAPPSDDDFQTGGQVETAQPQQLETEAQQPEPETETETTELTEEQRRTWQSEAGKAKAEAAALAEKTRLLEQQNQMLMATMTGLQNLQSQQPQPQMAKPEQEPELFNFIQRDAYEPSEAFDPSTTSGDAYAKYQRAVARWESKQTFAQQQRELEERNAQELTRKQAQDLAAAYPEFRNPINGQPNYQAIQAWMDDLSKRDWVQLKRAIDGVANTNGQSPAPPASSDAAIAKRADKPPAAGASGGGGTEPKKQPKAVEELARIYGNNLYIPPGAVIE